MQCSRCGARLVQGVLICPECGARQRRQPGSVRCGYCHGRVPVGLSVCPHCGRDVHPAGPRWGLWVLVAAILALAALWGLGRLPVEQMRQEVLDTRTKLASLVQVLDLPTFTPSPAVRVVASLRTPTPTAVVPAAVLTAQGMTITSTLSSPTPSVISQAITATVTATMTLAAPRSPDSETVAAPRGLGATPVEGEYYVVRAGDTLLGIAGQLGISWQLLAETNGLTGAAMLQIGQRLRLPVPTPSPTSTPTITPTAGVTPSSTPTAPAGRSSRPSVAAASPGTATMAASATRAATPSPARIAESSPTAPATATSKYVVQAGDTLAGIAARVGIPWETLAAANHIIDVAGLQVGQVLIVPLPGWAPTARPRPTVTPTPTATVALPTLPAPVLDRPGDGSRADGDRAQIELGWLPVPGMPAEAQYQVTIDWLEGGQKNSHSWTTSATAQRMPPWLWGHADPPGRRYTWYVTVVQVGTDGKGGEKVAPLSPPSASRVLEWQ